MHRFLLVTITHCLLAIFANAAAGDESLIRQLGKGLRVELQLEPSPHFVIENTSSEGGEGLRVAGVEQAKHLFVLTVQSSELKNPPAIIGNYELDENRLVFHPRFPLSPKVVYRLKIADELLHGQDLPSAEALLFSLPMRQSSATPRITAVYPTADALPENLLKFYVHFSQPMNRGEAYTRIHLLEDGVEIQEPFLELTEELWNADQTRFTLFVHPGRIKRGVQPRELQGSPLNDGGNYTLEIDRQWESPDGTALSEGFKKNFAVTPAIHEIVDPLAWKLDAPEVGTLSPVSLRFGAPLDHAMLQRVLEVKFNDGSRIDGDVTIQDHETHWSFVPLSPWKVGAYSIEVDTTLEDLCGNNLAAPFEVKLKSGVTETPAAKIAIEFIVK